MSRPLECEGGRYPGALVVREGFLEEETYRASFGEMSSVYMMRKEEESVPGGPLCEPS